MHPEHLPVGVDFVNGEIDRADLNNWWSGRSIPASRPGLREAYRLHNHDGEIRRGSFFFNPQKERSYGGSVFQYLRKLSHLNQRWNLSAEEPNDFNPFWLIWDPAANKPVCIDVL